VSALVLCKRCGAECSTMRVEYRVRQSAPRSGDGYGWEEILTTDAGIFCSPPCLWTYLESTTVAHPDPLTRQRDPFASDGPRLVGKDRGDRV
jgi:hypothetical protein